MRLLEVKSVKKVYTSRFGGNKVIALNNVNFSVDHGEYVAIMGESGAGKTTLLNLLATLDKASEGQILLNGKDLSQMNEKEAANFRRKHLGFVFQDFNLLDTFSLRDNIYLPLVLSGKNHKEYDALLEPIAKQLHIQIFYLRMNQQVHWIQKVQVKCWNSLKQSIVWDRQS